MRRSSRKWWKALSKGERSWIRQAHHERFRGVKLKSMALGATR
ncbi:MAG TPA: hypothetical protein VHO70_17070 [Chitinispirillaceae bacterium]|nr:hypothetical protein [Chitinispirillaceae bacterium]